MCTTETVACDNAQKLIRVFDMYHVLYIDIRIPNGYNFLLSVVHKKIIYSLAAIS